MIKVDTLAKGLAAPRRRRSWMTRLRVALFQPRDVLIVGINPRAQRFAAQLPDLGYRVLGFVDDEDREVLLWGPAQRVAGHDALAEYLRRNVVDEVILAMPSSSWKSRGQQVCEICVEQGITVRMLPDFVNPAMAMATVETIDHQPVITLRK